MLPIDPQNETAHSFVVFGASGRLAKRKIFPALWALYRDDRLPQGTKIFTFSRTKLHVSKYRLQCVPYMGLSKERDQKKYNSFWTNVHCVQGEYGNAADYVMLGEAMALQETKHKMIYANRIFYLAIPPIVFDNITLNLMRKCKSHKGWNRIVIEKPFGRNDITYRPYQLNLCQSFNESQIYLIDHYLSRKVMQNLFALRFANRIWSDSFNNNQIAAVMITVKNEKHVRGDYFNIYGIIRDVMTNHMMQLLTMVAMDQPFSNDVEEMRNERYRVLKDILTLDMTDVILGQYRNNFMESDPEKVGYTEHSYIPTDSLTPTYAMVVLKINNKRWSDVPFILRAGKAMNETKTEVRIQYKSVESDLYNPNELDIRNELVLRLAPYEEIFMRVQLKKPGEELCLQDTEINMYMNEKSLKSSSNYASLLLDIFNGNQEFFMRTDEQCEIWRIFSGVLNAIDVERPKPFLYDYGSRGPIPAYRKAERSGFVFFAPENWHESKDTLAYGEEQ
ncbi:glucose-6-phosphate 1-dehydrogenase [Drosophila tropicalis]|uniref:glucose-6-phosphate 1-dehydrogenase n=1 Tax=Drosophila tropicalis TaxID=46794 RepID=UPI0035ABD694